MSNRAPAREASRYPRVVQFFLETPWSIQPEKLADIRAMLAMHVRGEHLTDEEIEQRIGAGPARRDANKVSNGQRAVAVIPINGVITPKADLMSDTSGGTSIDRLQQTFRSAVADPNVSAIVLDINSPGGSVSMITEMAQEIRAARRVKPVVAVANTAAGSAAYQLASQASEVVVTPSGQVGSIGTIAAHDDISAALEQQGVKTTVVTSSKFKGELSPFAPLSEDAKAQMQKVVDAHGRQFELDVARGRGVPVETVRADFGQGRMLMAKDAVAAGMADRVGTLDSVVSGLLSDQYAPKQTFQAGSALTEALVDSASAAAADTTAGPIKPSSTPTTDAAWDGPAMKANLSNDQPETYRQAFAWFDAQGADPDGDGYPDQKSDYKFIHHMVSDTGAVGAANETACEQGIAVLNGGRTGTTIPDADRQGVWEHLARHLRDAGRTPPPLKNLAEQETVTGLSFVDEALALHDSAHAFVDRTASLAEVERGHLTVAKRDRLTACTEALREAVTTLESVLAATDKPKQAAPPDELLHERLRYERHRATLIGGTP